jgi:Uma2 family endonuclease
MTHLVQVVRLLFEPGDRLSLDEFLERWEQMPELKFAELIDGVVHMPSPVSIEHGDRDSQLNLLLGTYAMRTRVCAVGSNATWLMVGSAPQPDIALRLLSEFGGRTTVSRGLASGAPELVVEISHSSRSFDLGPKLALYQRAGITEYVVALLEEQRVEWRILEGASYRLLEADSSGVLKSVQFAGLWLNEPAFWQGDAAGMMATLEDGLRSEKCREFLSRTVKLRNPEL